MTFQLINLIDYGQVLSTRERGHQAADELQRALEDSSVVLNFAGVEVASASFLDEVLSRLRGLLVGAEAKMVVVTETNEDVSETLELVLQRRKMALASLERGQVKLLGGSKQLNATLEAASELQSFKAPELAERLKLKLPNLHQRLKALTDAGALAREADPSATSGVRYDYEAVGSESLNQVVVESGAER